MSRDLNDWTQQLRELLAELKSQDFGYPLGRNEILSPGPATPDTPLELEPLYAVTDGAVLEDVHVGYFIDTAARVAAAADRGEPTRIEGETPARIWVFGSDGGGGRFAISRNEGSIWYLPASGEVRSGTFYEDARVKARRCAATLSEFLWRLRDDVAAFVRQEPRHEYIS
jgi:hypothetical protein